MDRIHEMKQKVIGVASFSHLFLASAIIGSVSGDRVSRPAESSAVVDSLMEAMAEQRRTVLFSLFDSQNGPLYRHEYPLLRRTEAASSAS